MAESASDDKRANIRQRALRLLAVRERSRKELIDRLGHDATDVVEELGRLGLQDDARFAREWTRSRVARFYGPVRVRRELAQKGVDSHIIDAVVEETYGGAAEHELAEQAVLKHTRAVEGKPPEAQARILYAYLVRHGFHTGLAASLAGEHLYEQRSRQSGDRDAGSD